MQIDFRISCSSNVGRNGITLVEVLVVLGVAGLLMALLIPAVQSSREAGRRMLCKSNLRQAMIAQHQYAEVFGAFPGLEGQFYYQISDFIEIPKETFRDSDRQLFYCPDDSLEKRGTYASFYSYLANTGLRRDGYRGVGDGFSGGMKLDGEHSKDIYIRPQDISDGLSMTAAVSERLVLPQIYVHDVDWDDYPEWWNRLVRVTTTRYSDEELTEMADDCQWNAGPVRAKQVKTRFYNHIVTPNQNSCTNGIPFDNYLNFPLPATSLHPQGVNVALADGAVRFISDSISRDVWWALGTRNGNETVSF